MKRRFFLLLILTGLEHLLSAQSLTKKQAFEFADKLSKVEILSEKGSELLKKDITQNRLTRFSTLDFIPTGYETITDSNLSVAQLLFFCEKAFVNEYYFRTGFEEWKRLENEYDRNHNYSFDLPYYKERDKEIKLQMKNYAGYVLEAKIKNEETFSPASIPASFISRWSISNDSEQEKEYGLIHPSRSTLGKTCTRTLNDLFKIGIIDSIVYREALTGIKNNRLRTEDTLLNYVADRVAYYENFNENKPRAIGFISTLKKADILSETNYTTLLQAAERKELITSFRLLDYCDHGKILDLTKYSNDPVIGYRQFLDDISRLVPEFKYKELSIRVEEDPDFFYAPLPEEKDSEEAHFDAIIEFRVDSFLYTQTFSLGEKYTGSDSLILIMRPANTPLKIEGTFISSVNKVLADKNSKWRVYDVIPYTKEQMRDYTKFGLLLLTKEQAKVWIQPTIYMSMDTTDHSTIYNSHYIRRLLDEYKMIGLFDHLTKEEMEKGETCIRKKTINDGDLLTCFPKMIVYYPYDIKGWRDPYENMTQAIVEASRGAFIPADVLVSYNQRSGDTYYSFTFKGKTYKTKIQLDYSYNLDINFLLLIEKALKKNKIDGDFYRYMGYDDHTSYIFLTKKQFDHLTKNRPELFIRK